MLRVLACLLFFVFSVSAYAQKQLVLIRNDRVVGRFTEGDYIYLVMKDGSKREGKIIELQEFSAITSNDTVAFNKIGKVGIPKGQRRGVAPLLGGLLLVTGTAFLGLELLNSATGHTASGGVDPSLVKTSAILIGVGGALVFIKPKYHKLDGRIFLRTIDYKSRWYKSPYN